VLYTLTADHGTNGQRCLSQLAPAFCCVWGTYRQASAICTPIFGFSHGLILQIPDGSIADLYPIQDNYVNVSGNLRSPKSLTELCVEALCRSLPYLDGELPSGLPQDVVDDVIHSLVQHSALTATTLRVLRNCELGTLTLAKSRGVTDAWLAPFLHRHDVTDAIQAMPPSPAETIMNNDDSSIMDTEMDLDDEEGIGENIEDPDSKPASDIFYGTFKAHTLDPDCESASFASVNEDNDSQSFSMDVSIKKEPVAVKRSSTSSLASSVTSNLTLLDIRGSQGLTDRGLLQLTHLRNLQVAKLDQCHSLTGRGLLALCQSHKLHSLSLANCRRLTDEAVINISHLTSLQALSLGGCRCLTDRSLAAISELYNLQKLDLSQCDLITDQGLDELKHLAMLQELSLGWCREITDEGVRRFTDHPGRDHSLRVLRLARCTISDYGVAHLARLQALEELDLNGCAGIKSSALGQTLEKLKRLTVLDVSHCPGIM
jgi:Leucine Rich repeat